MELQLGLALPTTHHNSTKGLETKDSFDTKKSFKNKRGFEDAFGNIIGDELQKVPPLLLWSGQPNEEEDDRDRQRKRNSSTIINNEEEAQEKRVVGWPPIQSWRKKLMTNHHDHQVGRIENNNHNRMADNNDHSHKENGGSNPKYYVKVKMEGVAITRKVNLRLYHSFHTLTNSLIAMFAKYQKCGKESVQYTLTYQDKEGHWLLAEDVPWRMFVESVQRLEILSNRSS
ncbi:hypothetical protein JRO89_XS03G0254000 [Xanthoceras sorbifolium]|uniref:Auxin-responsive protein n=1 Tax=Xanthoceras sorbifolium TaxID=99658 RepID=A0ABQ8IBT7_9ROSI|nr:hypothetical protein JRO89_XS03G0254000 [Xanthoceras sorbifolium]